MAKNKYLIAGIIFLLASVFFFASTGPYFTFFPTQEVDLTRADFGPLTAGNIFIQEITLKKDYLSRVDLYIGKINNDNLNEDVFLLFDNSQRILYSKRFTSREIVKADFYPFELKTPLRIGKGQKVFAAIYSIDGSADNHLVIPLNPGSSLGKFCVAPIPNNDIPLTLANLRIAAPIGGSIGFKTYESNSVIFTFSRVILYLFMIIISLGIIFAKKLKMLLLKVRLHPQHAFISIVIVFGLLFMIITPPFQTPDEPVHFYRAYEISTHNITKYKDEVPHSLVDMAAIQERMKFKSWEKTSKKEILSLAKIKLDAGNLTPVGTLEYTLPYLPQALGIAIGKLFNLAPIWLLYMARLFNLLISCILIFYAIQITPVHKWVFFLLGVMPMTVSQVASVSYDGLTIGLSFLLTSIILNFAFNAAKNIKPRDILALFVVAILLALSKPPYFIIAFSFLIIPVSKFGNWKKFVGLFLGLVLSTLLVSQLWPATKEFVQSLFVGKANAATMALTLDLPELIHGPEAKTVAVKMQSLLAQVSQPNLQIQTNQQKLLSHPLHQNQLAQNNQQNQPDRQTQPTQQPSQSNTNPAAQPIQPVQDTSQTAQADPPRAEPENPFNPEAQKQFILGNPTRYIGIMMGTVHKYFGLYMTSIVGLFGWNDTGLPDFLVYLFILLLIFTALADATKGIRIGFLKKMTGLLIVIAGVIIIETGLYIYSNLPTADFIVGVQGRYFIPLIPMFLLIFYNRFVPDTMGNYFSSANIKPIKGKVNPGKKTKTSIPTDDPGFALLFPWMLMALSIFTLCYSLLSIVSRFYIISG